MGLFPSKDGIYNFHMFLFCTMTVSLYSSLTISNHLKHFGHVRKKLSESILKNFKSHLSLRNLMGQVDATIEAKTEKLLKHSEASLKLLADALHYRLVKELPSSDVTNSFGVKTTVSSFNAMKVLLQSPPRSLTKSLNETVSSFFQSHETSLSETALEEPKKSSNKKKSKKKKSIEHLTKNISSSTLNGNDSFLNMSRNSIDTKTPLTSSPASSPNSIQSPSFRFKSKPIKKTNRFESNIPRVANDFHTDKNDYYNQTKFNSNSRYNNFGYSNKCMRFLFV
jgi:hypothetical protein